MNFRFGNQHTIARDVWCSGVGLHSGLNVSMRLRPAPPGYGVRFRRMDIPEAPTISAHFHNVVDTFQATTIGFDGVVVSTIEHLMAAFYGSGVNNALVELDGPEVPILDGSAAPYLKLIERANLREQHAVRNHLIIRRPVTVSDGDSYIKATPCNRFRVRYFIDYSHPLVGKQERSWTFESGTFGTEIAQARTFGFLKDVRKLQTMGLIQGGSLANAVVFTEEDLLNEDGFRYADECVRHKILDFIGDLALTGMSVLGFFEVRKAGHALHSRFLHQLMARHTCAAPRPFPVSAINVAHAASALACCLNQHNKPLQ
ncbi:MAG: UDP-3-O-acyl-N-acetylglucosamine deacetylase [Desulfobacteraceae bacterium]|nr:UDP-3-O-acyl-N-acetylglucosamine deacetylase [Desulfobacteraceae bacterium]